MVSLRAYNREIEQLIDNGRYDEAIAHCKHILLSYPKYIEAYRNLGKTLLEAKRYPEARDIFSRVISVFPDDFIAHIGLSIIAEDNRDLDLSIWHMERAFDMQPSNVAIQEELKRLFSRRDGASPQKIRLSRGALVRMYARGELFAQAITEINNIQLEDPKRFELEVLLAKMKYHSGAIEETISICNQILEKNPYCYEANQLMLELFMNKKEHERAIVHKNRLVSLDPYYRYLTNSHSTADVPEGKIEIEKLLYLPYTQEATIPMWLQSENGPENDSVGHDLDWLKNLEAKESPIAPVFSSSLEGKSTHIASSQPDNLSETISAENDSIPDWMKNAGWETVQADLQPDNSEKQVENIEINANSSKTPDWLNPSVSLLSDNFSETTQIMDNNVSPDANHEFAGLSPTTPNPFFETKEEANMDTNENLGNDQSNSENNSDWLRQFAVNPDDSTSSNDQDLPDWLKNFDKDEKVQEDSSDEMPDWLKNLQEEGEPDLKSVEPVLESTVELSEELDSTRAMDQLSAEVIPTETISEPLPNEELFKETTSSSPADGWEKVEILESNESHLSEEDTLEPIKKDPDDIIPDWVKSVLNSTPQIEPVQQDDVLPNQEVSETVEATQDISKSTESIGPVYANGEEGGISQQTNDELLEWLRGLKTEDERNDIKDATLNTNDQADEENVVESLGRLEEITGSVSIPIEDFTTEVKDEVINQIDPIGEEESPVRPIDTPESEEMLESISTATEVVDEMIQNETPTMPVLTIHQQLSNEINLPSDEDQLVQELLKDKPYEEVPAMINGLVKSGNDFSELLSAFQQVHSQDFNDFRYWQCLGDIYAKRDQLSDALSAYQQAEEILVKKISN